MPTDRESRESPHWSDALARTNACDGAIAWARTRPSLDRAWKICERGDWMLWLAGRLAGPPGDDSRRPLVLAACDCAELSAHLVSDEAQTAIALALVVARDWAGGGASDLDDCRYAAAAAAEAAAAADADADADAAYTAAAAVRAQTLSACADIARRYYPDALPVGAIVTLPRGAQ